MLSAIVVPQGQRSLQPEMQVEVPARSGIVVTPLYLCSVRVDLLEKVLIGEGQSSILKR
jgi:hypothetical protein